MGEVSGAAEALGIHPGMRLGEALARCPGAAARPARPRARRARMGGGARRARGDRGRGRAGGARARPTSTPRRCAGCTGATWRACSPARAGRSRCRPGWARPRAASAPSPPRARARPGRGAKIVPAGAERAFLAPLPVSLLARAARRRELAPALERLGVRTLGELAALPAGDLADRFGEPGLRARELAHGRDTPLRPRAPGERARGADRAARGGLGAPAPARSGAADRSAARAARAARARAAQLRLGARFVERGTWRREVPLRQATRRRASGCGWRWCRGSPSCPPRSSSSA